MSDGAKPVSVTILDKEYLISCAEDEREQLHAAAAFLNEKMNEVKRGGKVVGSERVAVMAALNIAHELIASRVQADSFSNSVDHTLRRLNSKISEALSSPPAVEH